MRIEYCQQDGFIGGTAIDVGMCSFIPFVDLQCRFSLLVSNLMLTFQIR